MNPQVQSAFRTVLKVLGGYFIARGYIEQSDLEVLISALAILSAVFWSSYHHHSITMLHDSYRAYFAADSESEEENPQ